MFNAFLVSLLISLHVSEQEDHDKQSVVGVTKGTIMIGGLVAIYETDGENNVNCNLTDISPFGIQRAEAMRYAVHKINSNRNILPNISFGIEIRDSCGSETRALDESLRFVIDRVRVCTDKTNQNSSLFGVVGASTSLITAEVANLLRLFRIPLISYAATSTGLSDHSKFDFLLRTVPPDSFQSLAMINFIQTKLKWKSVFLLYSTGSYGEYGHKSFKDAIEKATGDKENRLCLVQSERILPGSSKNEVKDFLENFSKQEAGVTGIVCYCEVHDIKTVIDALEDDPKRFGRFRLIGSDNFLFGPKSNRSIIFSLHYSEAELNDFHENWYNKLTPDNVHETLNPWFQKYWDVKCKNDTSCSLCDRNPQTNDISCPRDDKISHIIDAVSAFAHAIDNALRTKYKGNLSRLLESVHAKNDSFLKDHLMKVRFRGVSSIVEFPANDSVARGIYDISRFDENGELIYIGLWNATNINAVWSKKNKEFFGESSCQEQCKPGRKQTQKATACCWRCEECKPKEYLSQKNVCKKCGDGEKPDNHQTICLKLPVRHINSKWKAVIYLITSLGIFATGYTIKTFITHNDTPLVKGSGRELTYVLLFGILMLFCVPIMLLVYPDNIICGVARFSIGFFLSICYASLLVKTNRIARIFSGRPDLLFLTPAWQVILTVFLIMPQVLISVIGLISHPPVKDVDYSFIDYGIIKCKSNTPDLIGAIAYNIVLVIICTYYAFLTRKAPANFNEARYIGFVMYTTIVIWLAFLPVFFGTSSEYKTIFIMLDLVMNAVTLLVGLFGIKLYVIVLRPDKNSRTNSRLRSITTNSEAFFTDHHDNVDAQSFHGKLSPRKNVVHFRKTPTDTSLVTIDDSNSSNLPRNSMCKSENRDLMKDEINANVLNVPQFSATSIEQQNADWKNADWRNTVTKSLDQNLDTVGGELTLNDIQLHQTIRKTVTL